MDEETKKDVIKRNLCIFFIFQNFPATDEWFSMKMTLWQPAVTVCY